MEVKLVMFKSDGQRRELVIRHSNMLIGRHTDCHLQIPLAQVSRKHCQVLVDDESVSVKDLGSSNGTFVNGSRVQAAELQPGDQLVVGPVIFTVVIDGKPEEISPIRTIIEEQSVEPITHSDDETGNTVDVEATEEVVEIGENEEDEGGGDDPLSALSNLTKKRAKPT
ncbi:MAG: FHA domain-containing protein [Phycisphaerae bacterium]